MRPPRSTNGWRSHIGGSARTTWPPPTLRPRRASTTSSASNRRGSAGRRPLAGLTKRELEILTAIARGATNRQVAQQIFISEKTVARHLANIYAKLGVSSRTAAVDWAHQHNLLQ